ncbi:hypothetical protein CI109_105389 [Kwoniella shandongensis]|uniref:Uncharacterized protein n=1 Tax=Kwoniella shandongensis TaxID=1734106 RepID=A0A5M6BT25_9TREE|nr:uncharacterized protein CI109_006310 [Kwoniella shandongensis]KAA5525331.1 hypothetical protein CI109_006310 [Kwoniella shandongensis]
MFGRWDALAITILLSGLKVTIVSGQQIQGGCLRLLGSLACPAYQYAYLSPGNLSNAFPFFSSVTDVASFDVAALNYFVNQYQFTTTKFGEGQLGCTNASNAVLRWERTVLCSQWVNEQWSIECTALYNSSSAATSMKMVCQNTCLEYSANEHQVVNDTRFCPGPDLTNGARDAQLTKDYVDCTNWTTYATNDSATCVQGTDNEGNCGFGTSVSQLCEFCAGNNPDDCCYAGTTDMSVCGYTLPVRTNFTSSAPATAVQTSSQPTSTTSGTSANDNAGTSHKLTGGKLAGTIVGAVIGGLLLLGLLILLLFCCRRKRRNNKRDSASSFAASQAGGGAGGVFGSFFGGNGVRNSSGPQNNSEKGLLGNNASSPTMGGDTLYSPSFSNGNGNGHGKGMDGLGVGAFAGGLPAGTRTSGVVLPRVRDENQNGNRWIEPGMEVTVLWPYQASLPDELDLRPGMKLRVVRLYDDAWGTAEVINGPEHHEIGKQGAFPIVCVSEGSSLGSSTSNSTDSH